ncbi:hypothetical protein [Streptomyces collinus]|uniref:hypothetical protein n=1 Tax=Streptomyces collinus TaxID=42684 RepID=UPI0034431C9B
MSAQGAPKTYSLTIILSVSAEIILLVAISFYFWEIYSVSHREYAAFMLFALSGAIGGALRTGTYLLALTNLTDRERHQWSIEALLGPLLGAAAGLAVYLVVKASLMPDGATVNVAGQFILSLVAGALSLSQFGKIAERGLVRGSMSRSGILGGEVSTTVPLLQRIDEMLEQRVSDLTLVNYDGFAGATAERIGGRRWLIRIEFVPLDPHSEAAEFTRRRFMSAGRVKIVGGSEREFVPFTVTAISDFYAAIPQSLSITVPRFAEGEPGTIILDAVTSCVGDGSATDDVPDVPWGAGVVLEIGQGVQTVQVIPINIDGSNGS